MLRSLSSTPPYSLDDILVGVLLFRGEVRGVLVLCHGVIVCAGRARVLECGDSIGWDFGVGDACNGWYRDDEI
ncbi:hypothetical protein Tco_0517902 [Tanacetum coccineum]